MRTEAAFWDASAVVPLCVWQPPSAEIRRITRRYSRIVVWWGTPVEVRSALSRLYRSGEMDLEAHGAALRRLEHLRGIWSEVVPTERVRRIAEQIPDAYGLTAADALQLAAALVWCGEHPHNRPFVAVDKRLSAVAAMVGFAVATTG